MTDLQNTTPGHLHLDYFKNMVTMLIKKFQPLQIICFGKSTILMESSGSFMPQAANQKGYYCLLMVTESSARIDHEVQDFANAHYKQGSITILCHSKDSVSESIKSNSRFFIRVYTHGQLLYCHDGMTHFDFTARFVPDLAAVKAQKHFEHRSRLAEGFLQGAAACFSKQQYNVCVFMLHQVVEQCCIALVGVHMDYRLEIHNLSRLLHLCLSFSERPFNVFISEDLDDNRLFNVLVKSYSHSRYKDDFEVVYEDAKKLYDRVLMFVTLTGEMCEQKVMEIGNEGILYNEAVVYKDVCHE